MSIGLFKLSNPGRFKAEFEAIVEEKEGRVFWDRNDESLGEPFAFASTPMVQAIEMEDPCYRVFAALDSRFSGPWINLFLQENAFWEFSLRSGDQRLDRFSVTPQEWDEDPDFVEARKGHPEILASVWDVPVERIERYMVNWNPGMAWSDEHQREVYGYQINGKAYPEDEHSYGNVWQAIDFIHALGGEYPYNGTAGRIRLPPSGGWL